VVNASASDSSAELRLLPYCRDGDLVSCENQAIRGIQHDGGYAEVLIARASGLISVPEGLDSVAARPCCCRPNHI